MLKLGWVPKIFHGILKSCYLAKKVDNEKIYVKEFEFVF